ncbi:MAG: hypothetical protein LCI00_05610 [Chloroflexi bacterium]|nr:hypothetical protein [Chloroflexota bacterium]
MKLTFTFADSTDPIHLKKYSYSSSIEFPDEALQLPDCRERVLKLCELVGKLTTVVLVVSCSKLGLRDFPIKTIKESIYSTRHLWHTIVLRLERDSRLRDNRHDLKIMSPIQSPFPHYPSSKRGRKPSLTRELRRHDRLKQISPQEQAYLDIIEALGAAYAGLLNGSLPADTDKGSQWQFSGFHPDWKDPTLINRFNKRATEERRQSRLAAKAQERMQKQQELSKASPPAVSSAYEPKTGAGRRVGAVPGVFKGIQFRSQLEIRFVTQLEEMGIRWVYEPERLSDGNYLVDFYLPDLKIWVEVKGRFEPRDNFLLKDVAAYLKRERNERLYAFSASKAYAINSRSFNEINHKLFWSKISSGS